MVRVSVFYPKAEGKSFNFDYYLEKHMRLVDERLTPFGLLKSSVDKGMPSSEFGPPPFIAVAHLEFETMDAYEKAFAHAGDELIADVPNYTDIEPIIQTNEVVK